MGLAAVGVLLATARRAEAHGCDSTAGGTGFADEGFAEGCGRVGVLAGDEFAVLDDVRGGDQDGQDQAEGVRDQVPLASFALLAGIDA